MAGAFIRGDARLVAALTERGLVRIQPHSPADSAWLPRATLLALQGVPITCAVSYVPTAGLSARRVLASEEPTGVPAGERLEDVATQASVAPF